VVNMVSPSPSCFILDMHIVRWARALALLKAGRSIAARIAMIAMTTSNSIKVKPRGLRLGNPPGLGAGLKEFMRALIGLAIIYRLRTTL
jgi:hypothetical protein